LVSAVHDVGLEVHDVENLRFHYARTLAGWCANLEANWEECVAEVGENTCRVWGLYMAGSRLAFERNEIQLHHILAAKVGDNGSNGFPLRPTW
jgi:cyclopropane-fatty-acyl-phospholipid synthase